MNITDAIIRQCRLQPDEIAIIEDGQAHSYRQLHLRIHEAMARLREAGVRRHAGVALDFGVTLPSIVTILALIRLGAVTSILRSTYTRAEKKALMTRHDVAFVVHDPAASWHEPDPDLPAFKRLPLADIAGTPPAANASPPESEPDSYDAGNDLCLINTTSGTTGEKKSIALTHAELGVRLGLDPKLWLPESRRLFMCFNLEASLTKPMIIRTLSVGNTLIIGTNQTPAWFFEVIERDRPTLIATATGAIPYLVDISRRAPEAARLRELTSARICVTGSALPRAQLLWMMNHLGPNVEVLLGASETSRTGSVDARSQLEQPDLSSILLPWVHMEALDEAGRVLPAGQQGLLRIRSPGMARGYFRDPEATAQNFQGGWFLSGDMGSVDEAGRVRLAGRANNMVNLGGSKINLERIERVIDEHPGVVESAAVVIERGGLAQPHLAAVITPQAGIDKDRLTREVSHLCASELGLYYVPSVVLFTKSLPRNGFGKIQRSVLVEQVTPLFKDRHA